MEKQLCRWRRWSTYQSGTAYSWYVSVPVWNATEAFCSDSIWKIQRLYSRWWGYYRYGIRQWKDRHIYTIHRRSLSRRATWDYRNEGKNSFGRRHAHHYKTQRCMWVYQERRSQLKAEYDIYRGNYTVREGIWAICTVIWKFCKCGA